MAFKVNGIESEDDLKRAQAAAQAQGTSIPNYQDWANVLETLQEAGVESTGSYESDKLKLQELEDQVNDFIQKMQEEKIADEKKKEQEQVKDTSESDKDQEIKATVANATSSMILADYMKYYHLMS